MEVRARYGSSVLCASLVLCLMALQLPLGCKKAESARKPAQNTNPAEVSIAPELTSQLTIGEPELRDVVGTLRVAARVETVGSRIARVGSPVAGRITKLIVLEGQNVRTGAVMALLHSTELSDTQFAFIKANSQEQLAEQSTKRAEQLVAADVIGRAELERRRAELLQASTEAAAIGAQLRGLGMTDAMLRRLEGSRKLNADYPIVAPIGGTVLERKVTLGQIVQPAEVAFTVADLSSVWIVADVPEEDAGSLAKGMEVSVTLPSLPGGMIHGRLSYVAPVVDPATRTVQVHMELPNPKGVYKPAMLASMTFLGSAQRKLTVPATAVVRQDNSDYVFVRIGPNRFVLRAVQLGDDSSDRRVLESGISPGEKVVLDGAFHLNNQRKQNAIEGEN